MHSYYYSICFFLSFFFLLSSRPQHKGYNFLLLLIFVLVNHEPTHIQHQYISYTVERSQYSNLLSPPCGWVSSLPHMSAFTYERHLCIIWASLWHLGPRYSGTTNPQNTNIYVYTHLTVDVLKYNYLTKNIPLLACKVLYRFYIIYNIQYI